MLPLSKMNEGVFRSPESGGTYCSLWGGRDYVISYSKDCCILRLAANCLVSANHVVNMHRCPSVKKQGSSQLPIILLYTYVVDCPY